MMRSANPGDGPVAKMLLKQFSKRGATYCIHKILRIY